MQPNLLYRTFDSTVLERGGVIELRKKPSALLVIAALCFVAAGLAVAGGRWLSGFEDFHAVGLFAAGAGALFAILGGLGLVAAVAPSLRYSARSSL
jgi:hypothetical protein